MILLDLQAMDSESAALGASTLSAVSVYLCPNSAMSAEVCCRSDLSIVLCA